MRFRRPSWIEPVDSFGEWAGFVAGLLIVGGLAVVVVAGLTWRGTRIAKAIPQVACGFDATDSCNWSVPVVRNDTHVVVVLKQCDHHGGKGDSCGEPIAIPPGGTSPAGNYEGIQAFVGELTWIGVYQREHRIGCLVVSGHSTKHNGDLVLVSDAGRCGDATAPATRIVGRV